MRETVSSRMALSRTRGDLESDASEGESEAEATDEVEVAEGAEGVLDLVEANELEADDAEVFLAAWRGELDGKSVGAKRRTH